MRNKAFRRHQRERYIAKRLKIIRTCWLWDGEDLKSDPYPDWVIKGRYDKYNLTCSCSMCQAGRRTKPYSRNQEKAFTEQMIA